MVNLNTKIQWTDATWSPVTGCTKVSAGCKHCYAEAQFPRTASGQTITTGYRRAGCFGDRPVTRPRRFTDVRCHPDRLDKPLHWRKPRRVFVNSMSDLFHEDVPDEFIDLVFGVMALTQHVGRCRARDCDHEGTCENVDPPTQHTYQILTKRPERMRVYMQSLTRDRLTDGARASWAFTDGAFDDLPLPLPNVWLGVSVENQDHEDRIRILLDTPAAVRFVSAEPLLGPVDFSYGQLSGCDACCTGDRCPGPPECMRRDRRSCHVCNGTASGINLDWVIVGGESGPKARPCDVLWIRSIVEQCKAAGVACFVKQLGANPVEMGGEFGVELLDRKGGNPSQWPEDLRVRQWPKKKRPHESGQ